MSRDGDRAIPAPQIRPYIRHAAPGQPIELMSQGGHAAEPLDDDAAAELMRELAEALRRNGRNLYVVTTRRPVRGLDTRRESER